VPVRRRNDRLPAAEGVRKCTGPNLASVEIRSQAIEDTGLTTMFGNWLIHLSGDTSDLRPSPAAPFVQPQTIGAAEIRNALPWPVRCQSFGLRKP
jgi:hypothetical protein